MKRITGLITAPFTGFKDDGGVDLQAVEKQQRFYKDNGISGVFVCGTTGEGSSLTLSEKKALFKEWARYRDDDFATIGFLGGTSVPECRELMTFAKECGLDAVAMTAPYYQKAANVRELALTLAEVASAEPDMPFFYYHIPSLTHVCPTMFSLLKEVDGLIPNFSGIKFTFENMMDYQLCHEFKDRKYNIMWGRDEMMLPALSIGAETFVGSTYGYNAPIYLAIMQAFRDGDMARAAQLQYKANLIITRLDKYGNGAGKAFMKAAGLDLGPCRRPLTTMPGEIYARFTEDLQGTEFYNYRCTFNGSKNNTK